MAIERRAEVVWEADLERGNGRVTMSTSRVLVDQPVSWPSRTSAPDGQRTSPQTSPEELIAAAHASCYSMSLAGTLARAGYKPDRLEVSVTVAFAQVDGQWMVASSRVDAHGTVPGIDQSVFQKLADEAMAGCPVTRALQGNVEMSVDATISSTELAASAGP